MRKQYFETLIDIYALPIRVSFHLGMLGMHVFNSNYNSVQPAENPEEEKNAVLKCTSQKRLF